MKDKRSRFRKRKDDAILSAYSRHQYQKALLKKSVELDVPKDSIRHKGGHMKAKAKGLTALRLWFNRLPPPGMAMARDNMKAELCKTDKEILEDIEFDLAMAKEENATPIDDGDSEQGDATP